MYEIKMLDFVIDSGKSSCDCNLNIRKENIRRKNYTIILDVLFAVIEYHPLTDFSNPFRHIFGAIGAIYIEGHAWFSTSRGIA